MLCYSDPERSNATQLKKRSANREILRKHRKNIGIQSRNCSVILSSPKHLCFTSWIFFGFNFCCALFNLCCVFCAFAAFCYSLVFFRLQCIWPFRATISVGTNQPKCGMKTPPHQNGLSVFNYSLLLIPCSLPQRVFVCFPACCGFRGAFLDVVTCFLSYCCLPNSSNCSPLTCSISQPGPCLAQIQVQMWQIINNLLYNVFW